MCIALPGRILEVDGETHQARVDVMGQVRTVDVRLLDRVAAGEWVLVHTGFAVERLSEAEAAETVRLFEELAPVLEEAAAEGHGEGGA
jgi:hydrogenase expression/formation protein HypC